MTETVHPIHINITGHTMKQIVTAALAVLLFTAPALAADNATAPTSEKDKISYAIGMSIGKGLVGQQLDIEPEQVARGLQESMTGKQQLSDEEAQTVLQNFQRALMAAKQAEMQALAKKNGEEGAAFLAANGKKKGVVTLPSGLQYKVITAGKGAKPKATDTVTVNYKGTLINGTEFDSSFKRGEPATFPLNGVIRGWTEALQLMPEGSKWQLVIPAALAYGDRGAGRDIGPNSTLVFEVELLSIKK